MSSDVSIADLFEDYVESLQIIPAEIGHDMHQLRDVDEEYQRCREAYSKQRRAYIKHLQSPTTASTVSQTTAAIAASRLQVELEYKKAVQKQNQKIELARRMYDLVSRQIEHIDSQMAKSGIDNTGWIAQRSANKMDTADTSSYGIGTNDVRHEQAPRKRMLSNGQSSIKKRRSLHSFRPNISLNHGSELSQLAVDPNEPRYCICNQVSFGEMVACDGDHCEKEWFHYSCVGLIEPPAGKWFCEDCLAENNYNHKLV